jgi:erythromycin esterase-like protein
VRPGLAGSYEELFHATTIPRFWLNLSNGHDGAHELMSRSMLQRAIGVIYRPETERWSHYFQAQLAQQFDAMIHLDETRALDPLEPTAESPRGELPDTFPTSL